MTRSLLCEFDPFDVSDPAEMPELSTEPMPKTPWLSRWEFERGGKHWRVAVIVRDARGETVEVIDAREHIERIGSEPADRTYRMVIEEVKDAP